MTATASPRSFEIGVDIGGTFTDIVCRESGGGLHILKVPTTRGDPSEAVIRAIAELRERWGIAAAEITRFAHGTTVATNAVLERKGARIGLLTTAGFRDVLEIGRQMRGEVYRIILEPEAPVFLAPRRYRREIAERMDASGTVVIALDEAAVAERGRRAGAGRRRGDRHLLPVLLPQSRPRTARRRADPRPPSRAHAVALARGRSGVPRIRAHGRHRLRRLPEAAGRQLPGAPRTRPRPGRHQCAAAGHAIARRAGGRRGRPPAAGAAVPVRAGGRRDRRPDRRRLGIDRRSDHDRCRRHVGRHRADQRAQADAALRRHHRGPCRARGHGRRDHDRLGRRQHRPSRRGGRAPGRSALGRRRTGPGLLRARRRAGDGDRRLDRAGLSRSGVLRRRPAEARAGARRPRRSTARWRSRSASRPARRRSASIAC